MRLKRVARFAYRRAENMLTLMLAVMFLAFITQIAFRYLLNLPVGWASELTVVMWLWLVLWGAAFVLREDEEIRFDLVYSSVRGRARRIMTILGALALLALYILSMPAAYDYVAFMKVQSTAYMKIRFDHLFSIYLVFAVAVICRYLWILFKAVTGRDDARPDAQARERT